MSGPGEGPLDRAGGADIIDALPTGPAPRRPPTPSDAPLRLHPLSWLFTLVSRMRVFLIPMLAVWVLRRGGDDGGSAFEDPLFWGPLLGAGGVGFASILQFLTFRYGIGEDALVIRSGLLERSLRVIPFARIHNVGIEQNLLHRLFRVAKVRLESAGSEKPEAEMEVLELEAALALEALVRRRSAASGAVAAATHEQATDTGTLPSERLDGAPGTLPLPANAESGAQPLFTLTLKENLLLGLLSHRGMVAVGALIGALASLPGNLFGETLSELGRRAFGELELGWRILLLSTVQLVVLGLLAIKALSVVVTLLQDFNFRLTEDGRRLTTERGLLSVIRASVSRRRIQSWTLRATLLQRWFKRRALSIDIASRQAGEDRGQNVHALIPLGTPDRCDALILHVLPQSEFRALRFRPVPLRGWWRRMTGDLIFAFLAFGGLLTLALWREFNPFWALLSLLFIPFSVFQARRQAQVAAWALNAQLVAIRSGWPTEILRFAELDKVQTISLQRSVLDRRYGTATVWLDTAGAAVGTALKLPYLPLEEARTLTRHLSAELARRPLRW